MSIVMMGAAVVGHGSGPSRAVASQSLPDWPVSVWVVVVAVALVVVREGFRRCLAFVRG